MNKSTSRLRLEMLESRWNPAGTVTGTFAAGTWTLIGDEAANDITINPTATPNQFVLTGSSTTVSGVTNPTNVKNIVVKLLAGADSVTLNNTGSSGKLAGSLTVNGGTEANRVAISQMTIGGNISVTNGTNASGQDLFSMNDSTVLGKVTVTNGDGDTSTDFRSYIARSSFIGKGVTITNGQGTDYVFLVDYDVGGNFTVKNGLPGAGDFAGCTRIYSFSNAASMQVITGNVSVSYTSGKVDVDLLAGIEVEGNVSFNHGTGTSETVFDSDATNQPVIIHGSLSIVDKGPSKAFLGDGTGNSDGFAFRGNGMTVGKNLNITVGDGGSTLKLNKLTVGGSTKVQTGSGIDTISVDDSTFHAFQLLTGLGADVVNLEQKTGTSATTQFLGKTKVDLGGGADTFTLGIAAESTSQVEIFATASLSGGKDTDFDNIYSDNLVTPFFTPTYKFDNVI